MTILLKRHRNAILSGAILVLAAGLTYAVKALMEDDERDMEGSREMQQLIEPSPQRFTTKAVVVVLSPSILAANLPLANILNLTRNIVFLLPPKMRKTELLDSPGPMAREGMEQILHRYKLIECDNAKGMWFVVKHLKPDTLIVCEDDLPVECALPNELNHFVRDVVTVEQNSNDVLESVMPYLMA